MAIKKIHVVAIGLLVALVVSAGCTSGGWTSPSNKESGSQTVYKPEDYGNGVLYFPCVQADFGNSLSEYIGAHPNVKVVTVAPNDYSGYGYTTGYFVVVEQV